MLKISHTISFESNVRHCLGRHLQLSPIEWVNSLKTKIIL